MDIVIDFDGTVVKHKYPYVGEDIGAVPVLKKLVENGHRLILFTMRCDSPNPSIAIVRDNPELNTPSNQYLTDAVNWFKDNGIELYGIQRNPSQDEWTTSPKAYGHIIIDDAAIGCPLIFPENERPYVDWSAVEKLLSSLIFFNDIPKQRAATI